MFALYSKCHRALAFLALLRLLARGRGRAIFEYSNNMLDGFFVLHTGRGHANIDNIVHAFLCTLAAATWWKQLCLVCLGLLFV